MYTAKKVIGIKFDLVTKPTMLQLMEECNIFTIEKSSNGFFDICDCSGNYREAVVTGSQLAALGRELISFANEEQA